MKIRDRIKSLRRVRAGELIPNPRNWRTHPQEQQDALRGILAEVGYADALIARQTPDGLMLIDGHLRAEIDADAKVPVLVLDVTEEEADKIMLTLDPLAAMAEADEQRMAELLRCVDTECDAVKTMLGQLASDVGVYERVNAGPPPESVAKNASELDDIKRQRRDGNEATANKNDTERYLVVVFATREQKEQVLAQLGLPDDERYVPAESITIKPKRIMVPTRTTQGRGTAAPIEHSGAGG